MSVDLIRTDDDDFEIESTEQLEAAVVAIFHELLEGDDIGATDDFFDLGGDSLLAAALVTAIERDFGVSLPSSVLIAAPTPRQLVEVVNAARDRATPSSPLVAVNPMGKGPPVFWVHGMTGDVIVTHKLARAMGGARPVFGLRAIGLLSGEAVLSSIAEISRSYISEIKALRPEGPYLLIGQCGAAVIALDMALRLHALKDEVAGLILIDPAIARNHAPWLMNTGTKLMAEWRSAIESAQSAHDQMKSDPTLTGTDRRRLVNKGLKGAVATYIPKPYPGRTLLVHSATRRNVLLNPTRGFPSLLPNLTCAQVGQRHGTIFHEHGGELVAAINSFLDRVAPI